MWRPSPEGDPWTLASRVRAQPPSPGFAGGDVDQDAILAILAERYPVRVRQVGTSSVTLRLDMTGSVTAAFKPRTDSHPRGWQAEIAAYRVARALGMDNVPPALARRFARPVLEARFEPAHPGDWDTIRDEIRWDNPGVVRGAMIYWVPEMRRSELDTEAGLTPLWNGLSAEGPVPSDPRAADVAVMLAFDYLIGNWDRLSGGNVSQTANGERLFVRDHNVAFQAPLTGARYERVRGWLERVQRFPRGFVARLVDMDEATVRAAMAADPENEAQATLTDEQIAELMGRRRALLSYIAGLVALNGTDAVLAWD
ncbi:MAG: hypothetical protein AB7S26_25875 [Sandaracinaceae bacterium]